MLYNFVQANIGAGDAVLVAFDYSPGEAGEMDRVAEPILRHLIDLDARLILVSTRPEGPAVAQRLMGSLTPEEYVYGEQYINLGYQPGEAVGVQQLLAGLTARGRPDYVNGELAADSPVMADVQTREDLALLLVLTADRSVLRWWVEQARAAAPGESLPVVAGISAALEPVAAPYLDARAGQLQGVVGGLLGAAFYARDRGVSGGLMAWLDGLAAAHLAVIGLILIGAVAHLVQRIGKRGR